MLFLNEFKASSLFFRIVLIIQVSSIISADTTSTATALSTTSAPTASGQQTLSTGNTLMDLFFNSNSIIDNLKSAKDKVVSQVQSSVYLKQNLYPFVLFIVNLPVNMINSFSSSDYNSSQFSIINQNASDAQLNYGIDYNFGFSGGGDINSPFLFSVQNQKLIHQPINAKLMPETFTVTDSNGNKLQTYRTDVRQYPFNPIVPVMMQSFFGENGTKTWNYLMRLMSPYPEDIFLIKLFSLVFSASRNTLKESSNQNAYPTLTTLPLELLCLLQRLSMTPDVSALIQSNPSANAASLASYTLSSVSQITTPLDPLQLTYLKPNIASLILSLPDTIQNSLNQITISIPAVEKQEFKDSANRGLLSGLNYCGHLESIENFDDKISFLTKTLTPYVKKNLSSLTKTEVDKLCLSVLDLALNRLDWVYALFCLQFVPVSTTETIDPLAATINYTMAAATIGTIDKAAFEQKITQIFSDLASALQEFLTEIGKSSFTDQTILKTIMVQKDSLTPHKDAIVELAKAAIDTAVSYYSSGGVDTGFVSNSKALQSEMQAFFSFRDNQLQVLYDSSQVKVNLRDYINIKQYIFEKILYQKFDGDAGYVKSNSPLSLSDALTNSIAILVRSAKDMSKVDFLFRADPQPQKMLDINGNEERVVGVQAYNSLIAAPQSAKQTLANTLLQMKSNNTLYTAEKIAAAQKAFDDQTALCNTNKTKYLNYLRQYRSDRRDSSGVFQGLAFDPSFFLKTSNASDSSIQSDKIDTRARVIINQYNLTTANSMVRLAGYVDLCRLKLKLIDLQQKSEARTETQKITLNEASIASNSLKISQAQSLIDSLNAALPLTTSDAEKSQQIKDNIAELGAQIKNLNDQNKTLADSNKALAEVISTRETDIQNLNGLISNYSGFVSNTAFSQSAVRNAVISSNPANAGLVQKFLVDPANSANITDPTETGAITKIQTLLQSGNVSNFIKTGAFQKDLDFILASTISQGLSGGSSIGLSSVSADDISNAKQWASSMVSSVINGDKTLTNVNSQFLLDSQTDSKNFTDAAGIVFGNYFGTLARVLCFAARALLRSSQGILFESFLSSNDYFSSRSVEDTFSSSTFSSTLLSSISSAKALLLQVANSQTLEQEKSLSNLNNFIDALSLLLDNNDFWTSVNWVPSYLDKPNTLELDSDARSTQLQKSVVKILRERQDATKPSPEINKRLDAMVSLLLWYIKSIVTDSSILSGFLTKLINNLKVEIDKNNPDDKTAVSNLNLALTWINKNAKYGIFYYQYLQQVGQKTSISDFLFSEIGKLCLRNGMILSVFGATFDPFLSRTLGVDFKTLAKTSQYNISNALSTQVQNYSDFFSGLYKQTAIEPAETIPLATSSLATSSYYGSNSGSLGSSNSVIVSSKATQMQGVLADQTAASSTTGEISNQSPININNFTSSIAQTELTAIPADKA